MTYESVVVDAIKSWAKENGKDISAEEAEDLARYIRAQFL